ncbi:DUF1631 domain-containing protein [Ottowia sp. GY511]|uniref:DUF1631 family protein n=1 Tax=Ottowia flava TaxID=2675430 RepID=A0ABW4KUW1_9BURK|nr:DUF1631 family protein [Ottowia sp. GY511]TXK26635.1 DUF1631 domain-containing protein [Ottowia sp. GY511]
MQAVSTNSPLIKRSRQEAVFLASSMIDRCVEAASAALHEAERTAKSMATRIELGDAAAALTKQRATMRTGYAASVDDAIGKALNEARSQADAHKPEKGGRMLEADSSLALLDDAEVARFVEASRLQQTAMPVVEHALARLDSLMSSALGLPVVRADLNPLRPEILCNALLELLGSFGESTQIQSHWTRALARPFAGELQRLYEAIGKLLESQGVEEARYRLKLTEGGSLPPQKSGTGGSGTGNASGNGSGSAGSAPGGAPGQGVPATSGDGGASRRALFPHMGDLAQARPAVPQALIRDFLYRPQWVSENDEPLPPAYYEAVTAQLAGAIRASSHAPSFDEAAQARQRLRDKALSVVDRPARAVDVATPLPPQQWGEAAQPAARTRTLMELKSQATKISQALGLDAVRTLVSQVAGDHRVMAPVREAFVAMEPALLRMAMKDPRFFGDDHHPARRLIEGVAQRSFKYNDEYADEFEQFMAPVRDAVRELNDRPEASNSAFGAQLEQLETRWQAEDVVETDAQEAGLRSMHFAQERQTLADKVAWEFSLRSDLDRVPVVVADFLFQDWSLVIAHAQLTDKRGQLDPGGYLAVVTDLLWSVKREAVLKEPRRLFEVVPGVLQTLRRGLEMLGKEARETDTFFNALMRYHDPVLRLRRLRSARDAEASGLTRLDDDSSLLMPLDMETEALPLERPSPRVAEQPWLGRHERVAAGFDDHGSGMAPLEADEGMTSMASLDSGHPADEVSRFAEPEPAPAAVGDFVPLDQPEPALLGAPRISDAAHVPVPDAPPDDAELARQRAILERLRTGDWVDLRVRGQWRRAQLSWSSENGSLFMFVSRGGRPHSMTRRTCEKLIRTRHLRPVDAAAVVDKALRRLSDSPSAEHEHVTV